MRVVVQRVKQAVVAIDGQPTGQVGQGFVLLVGISDHDTEAEIDYLVRKITNLRVFSDDNGQMNLSLKDINGGILSISQFTLYANTKKGNRPSFTDAGAPDFAEKMYELFNERLLTTGVSVETGTFGADMQVTLTNDGPVTIIFDTNQK